MRDAGGVGGEGGGGVELVDGAVELFMGFAEGGRHGEWVIEVCQASGGELGAGVEHGLGEAFDFGTLVTSHFWPDEVVVDDVFTVPIVTF